MGTADSSSCAGDFVRYSGMHRPAIIIALYALFASVWILTTDRLVALLAPDPGLAELFASTKGVIFVTLSSALLLVLLKKIDKQSDAQDARYRAAQRDASAMRAMFASIVEASSDAIYAKDLEGRYLVMNPAAARMVGVGKTAEEIFPPEEAAALRAAAHKVAERGEIVTADEQVTVGGKARHFLTTQGPLRDANGEIIGIYGISRDVTERQREASRLALAATSFELAAFGISISDAATNRLLDVNPAFARERGRLRADFVGMAVIDLFPADSSSTVREAMAALDSDGHVVIETGHLRADGSVFPVIGDITLIRDASEQPSHCIAYWRDLTRRRRAERELALSAKAFELTEFAAAVSDARTNRFADVNAAFARQRGYERDELIGRDFLSIFPAAERDRARTLIAQGDGHGHLVFDSEHLRKDGNSFPVHIDLTVVHDETGVPLHRIAYVGDLTERRRSEAALADSELRYRNLFDTSPEAVLICDEDRVLAANAAALKLAGVSSPERLVGRSLFDFVPAPRMPAALERLARYRASGEAFPWQEDRGLRADGVEFDIEFVAVPFIESGRGLLQVIVRDLSERRVLEREVIEISTAEQARIGREIHDGLCQQLLALDLMLEAFHRGFRETGTGPKHDGSMQAIRTLGRQMLHEARSLANGSAPVRVDGASLEESLSRMISGATQSTGADARLTFSGAAPDLDPVTATHVYRIVQEAVANALKHAHANMIEVDISVSGDAFSLRVTDDGVGLSSASPAWGHLGLSIMRHRANIIGASLSFLTPAQGGTQVRCERGLAR